MQIQDLLIEMEALSADDPRYLKKALQTLRLERCRLLENGHTIQKQLDDLDYVIFKVNQMVDEKTDFTGAAFGFILLNYSLCLCRLLYSSSSNDRACRR